MAKNKMKTHQATAKRIKLSGGKKYLKRQAGQDHFNARESGKTTMGKRRSVSVNVVDRPAIRKLLPYTG